MVLLEYTYMYHYKLLPTDLHASVLNQTILFAFEVTFDVLVVTDNEQNHDETL